MSGNAGDLLTDDEADAIRRRCEAAGGREGGWKGETGALSCPDEDYDLWYARGPLVKVAGYAAGKAAVTAQAEFIGAAPADIRRLLAERAALLAEVAGLRGLAGGLAAALVAIERWQDFPATGTAYSYGCHFGSQGERDYMRGIAAAALARARAAGLP